MSFTFQKPIGAYADVKELEYIAAIHQTKDDDLESFVDGSIEAIDVKHFLLSRYGIRVTEDEVKRFIFYDLAGGDGTSDCIDLTEVVSMLIIPYLVKVTFVNDKTAEDHRKSHISGFEQEALLNLQRLREDVNESIVEDMLNIIMTETTGSKEPRPLTKELLHDIFMQYNEHDLIEDDALLDEMIGMASEGTLGTELLDVSSFTRGLTSDIKLYNPFNESKFTTHYEDVFGMVTSKRETMKTSTTQVHEVVDQDEEKEMLDESADKTVQSSLCTGIFESANEALKSPLNDPQISSLEDVIILTNSSVSNIAERGTVRNEGCGEEEQDRRVFTFSQIDSMADTFRRKFHFNLVWLAAIFGYLAYLNPILNPVNGEVLCSIEHKDTLRCKTANSIVLWLRIMGTMFVFVAPSVMILSLGNDIQKQSLWEIAGGMSGIVILIFFPIFYKNIDLVEEVGFSTKDENGMWTDTACNINLSIGVLLLIVQIFNIIRVVVPDGKLQKSKILTLILRGSGVRYEFGIKKSSATKVHKMIKNAYILHPMIAETESNSKKTTAMLNYNNESEKSERTGGFFWAWKRYLSGELLNREGIWTHSRLQVAYVTQLILSVMVPLAILYFANRVADDIYDNIFGRITDVLPLLARETYNDQCSSHFNPASCFFPRVNGTSLGLGFCKGVTLECATSKSDQKLNTAFNEHVAKLDGIGETVYCSYLKHYEYLPSDEPCPDLWYPTEPISTNTADSDATSSCKSVITLCLEPTGDPLTSLCIIGSRNFINFQFKDVGSGCLNHAIHSLFGFNGFKLLLESDRMEPDKVNAREKKTISIEEKLNSAHDTAHEFQNTAISWVPPRHIVRISLVVGSSCALVAGVANSLVNIPSQVLTALQFRTGSVKSLRDPRFVTYRHGILPTSYLIGVAIWSSFFMTILVLAVVGFAVFLVLFERTQAALLSFFSLAIGICATLLIRVIAVFFLDMYSYEGFYRKHPLVANISNVCFECWHLALSSGFVLARIVKLFGILCIYIGRYDQPILAEGVGEIGLKSLDSFPHIFKVDLLAIEAHRHPYIERLGMMYMMKLRHGRHFGRRAGSVWRLLFVTALMPWLRKHRIIEQDEEE